MQVLAVLVALLAGCGSSDETGGEDGAVVASARDGDTLLLVDGRRVRLVQVDAPELGAGECYGRRAFAELASLVPPGSRVELDRDPALDDSDRFGRLLRYVRLNGELVNLELVRRGAAAPYFFGGERGRHAQALLAAAEGARVAGRGLWGACPSARLLPERSVSTGGALP
jgi:micrococcal nuclease